MTLMPFEHREIQTVNAAHEIAEDKVADYYKFSLGQWKRHQYDVKTLEALRDDEITPNAFAMLSKGSRTGDALDLKTKGRDFYRICLQDHIILRALKRDTDLDLLPLLIYVFTHELIHIVRFCGFYQRFNVTDKYRDTEERVVHKTTFRILKDLSIPKLDHVLTSYENHRFLAITEM